ncbi:hypothetical protein JCM18237_12900 [Halorubrum luteum]
MRAPDDDADRIATLASAASDARTRLVASAATKEAATNDSGTSDATADGVVDTDAFEGDGSVRIAGTEVADAEEAALVAARDGLGPVVALYVEARTGDDWVRFSETEMQRLHQATSDWLAVYARCHGVTLDPDVTVREAAEALIDTHDITDVAALLTGLHRQ